jgi:hypothetical protein
MHGTYGLEEEKVGGEERSFLVIKENLMLMSLGGGCFVIAWFFKCALKTGMDGVLYS